MKNIAILTFHDAYNYGAVLQAIGLKSHLESQGASVKFFKLKDKSGSSILYSRLKSVFRTIFPHSDPMLRSAHGYDRSFSEYIARNLPVIEVESIEQLGELSAGFDAFIVGSDQIWNTNMVLLEGDAFRFYFLDVALKCKKISYAASFGVSTQPQDRIQRFNPLLKAFDAVSVRDDFSGKLVAAAGCREIATVCDPTLLWDFGRSMEPVRELPALEKPYIVTYCLNKENEAEYCRILSYLGKALSAPIVSITSSGHTYWELPGCDRYARTANPGEWLTLLANASFVFTDSFHGTIFSIKYERPFATFNHPNQRGDRTRDLASRYGFQDHLVTGSGSDLSGIKLTALQHKLHEEHIEYSKNWLQQVLQLPQGQR